MLGKRVLLLHRRVVWEFPTQPSRHQYAFFTKSFSTKSCGAGEDAFVASYLMSSCGMSPETAVSVSKKVHFTSVEQPDSVLDLLRKYGFTNVLISKLIRSHPRFLLSKPEKTILPKLEFFSSLGIANPDLAGMIASNPYLLGASLENQLLPVHNFLKSIGFDVKHKSFRYLVTKRLEDQIIPYYNVLKSVIPCDKKVAAAMKRTFWVFFKDRVRNLEPNIRCLEGAGIPISSVEYLLFCRQNAMLLEENLFRKTVNKVKELGFEPSKSSFVIAVGVLSWPSSQSAWNRSCEAYRKWGWSNDEILTAFGKHPDCITLSEKNLNKIMEFLVKKMGWNSQMIARSPVVFTYSLEKRIIPRCSLIQVLSSKGLIGKDLSLLSVMTPSEKDFLDKFVFRYEEKVPLLLSVYHGKIDVAELLTNGQ